MVHRLFPLVLWQKAQPVPVLRFLQTCHTNLGKRLSRHLSFNPTVVQRIAGNLRPAEAKSRRFPDRPAEAKSRRFPVE
jgi:hypothetical protein